MAADEEYTAGPDDLEALEHHHHEVGDVRVVVDDQCAVAAHAGAPARRPGG